jgi:mitochondrial fission protein ELM1
LCSASESKVIAAISTSASDVIPANSDSGGRRETPDIWVVTDGNAGNENQAVALAEAVGGQIAVHRLPLRPSWLVPFDRFRPPARFGLGGPPWPMLAIGAGRRSAAAVLAVGRAARGPTRLVQILRPGCGAARFDLVVTPRHDRYRGTNGIGTRGALSRVTPARLAEAATAWSSRFAGLPRPLVAVLIGGPSRSVPLPDGAMAGVAEALDGLLASGAGLMVTASRRTTPADAETLRAVLAGRPAHLWDGTGDNPYFAYLALADAILVTCDSIGMASDAASTGNPVHILHWAPLPRRLRRFHDGLAADGIARPYAGRIEHWSYLPLDDTAQVAARVRAMLQRDGVSLEAADATALI